MTYTITSQCIGCSRCQPVCPTGAVRYDGVNFQINADLCNSCIGSYGLPQCVAVCPTNGGCIPDVQEFWARWFMKYNRVVSRVQQAERAKYWESWFDTYSQHVSKLLQSHTTESSRLVTGH